MINIKSKHHYTMNKAGSNSGHLRKKLNVQKINFFYFFLDLNTIWEGPKAKKPLEIPFKPVYASWNMAKF